jgi:hypothetical protein
MSIPYEFMASPAEVMPISTESIAMRAPPVEPARALDAPRATGPASQESERLGSDSGNPLRDPWVRERFIGILV